MNPALFIYEGGNKSFKLVKTIFQYFKNKGGKTKAKVIER